MAKLNIDVAQVKKLVELAEAHGLQELTVEEADLSITVKGPSAAPIVVQQEVHAVAPAAIEAVPDGPAQPADEPQEQLQGNIVDIVAPLVGVFYRAPSPDAAFFVEVGDTIEVGSEVGLIEAMKVFSPIPSEIAGEVVAVPGENGKLVKQGEVLVRVRVAE